MLGHIGIKDISPEKHDLNYELNPNKMVENNILNKTDTSNKNINELSQ